MHFNDVAVDISSCFLTFSTMFTSPLFFASHSHIKTALTFSKITITLLGFTHTQGKRTRKQIFTGFHRCMSVHRGYRYMGCCKDTVNKRTVGILL